MRGPDKITGVGWIEIARMMGGWFPPDEDRVSPFSTLGIQANTNSGASRTIGAFTPAQVQGLVPWTCADVPFESPSIMLDQLRSLFQDRN
jgi:hypothetical protein